jgi:DUF4097 and DUF4098 domain-containing protein YvlB
MNWHRTIAFAAALVMAASPAYGQTASERAKARERERQRQEREREKEQQDKEREKERAQREKERERQRLCERRDDCDEYDDDWQPRSGEFRSVIDTSLAIDKRGIVDLSLSSGEITVTGWSRSDVRIKAQSEYGLLKLDASPARITLSIRSRSGRQGETKYEVSLPVGTRVITKTSSGETVIRGVKGEIDAQAVSGDIDVDDANERVSLETISGEITVQRATGDIRLTSVSGDVSLATATADVEVETVSGEITLTGLKSKFVRTETTSGDIEFDGAIDPAGRYEFRAHSGDVRVVLPSGAGASVDVETFSGTINSDFRIVLEPGETSLGVSPKRFDFKVGDGGARVSLESFSGDIRIVRGGTRTGERTEP